MRLITTLFLVIGASSAAAHDVYTALKSPTGRLCCGGDPVTGDCEAVSYRMRPSGDVDIVSRRYRATVLVSRDKITWSSVPGSTDEAHWCGIPRGALPDAADDPDPNFHTFCAFIAPGGS